MKVSLHRIKKVKPLETTCEMRKAFFLFAGIVTKLLLAVYFMKSNNETKKSSKKETSISCNLKETKQHYPFIVGGVIPKNEQLFCQDDFVKKPVDLKTFQQRGSMLLRC